MIDRIRTPNIAEMNGVDLRSDDVNRSGYTGPSSCGRLATICWYRGWRPCRDRLLREELYTRLLSGVMTGEYIMSRMLLAEGV